jgi:hypothetical protein
LGADAVEVCPGVPERRNLTDRREYSPTSFQKPEGISVVRSPPSLHPQILSILKDQLILQGTKIGDA